MSDLLHTYQHRFQNGKSVTLTVDFSGKELKMQSTRVPQNCEREYCAWRDSVVLPDVFNRATPGQVINATGAVLAGRKPKDATKSSSTSQSAS